ncbi:hypothetical protein BDD12DRAFT_902766 [Trichophaea hybrida]|nr:hypothetical protein BDD12DRAFT_902766 [Trichophaea hybrida]
MASKTQDPEFEVEHLSHTLRRVKLSLPPHSQVYPLPLPIFPSKFPTELQLVVFENCTVSSALALSQTCGSLRWTFDASKQTIVGKILRKLGCKGEADRLQQALIHAGSKHDTYVFPAITIERIIPSLLKAICSGGCYGKHGLCVTCWRLPGEEGLYRLLYNTWTVAVNNGSRHSKMEFHELAEVVEKALPASVSHGFLKICPPSRPASSVMRDVNPTAGCSNSSTAPANTSTALANASTGLSNPTAPRRNIRSRVVSPSVLANLHYSNVWSTSPTAAALPANPTPTPTLPSAAVRTRRPVTAHTAPPPTAARTAPPLTLLHTGPPAVRTRQPAAAGPRRPAATNTAHLPSTLLINPRTYATVLRGGMKYHNSSGLPPTTLPATPPTVQSRRPYTDTMAARGRMQSGRSPAPATPRPGIALPKRPTALAATNTAITAPAPRPRTSPIAAPRPNPVPNPVPTSVPTQFPVLPGVLSRVRLSLLLSSFKIPPSPNPTLAAWDALSVAVFEHVGIVDSGILERLSARRKNEWERFGGGNTLRDTIERKWRDEIFMRVHVLRKKV